MIISKTIRKYDLNPGIDYVTQGIVPRITQRLGYVVCQYAGDGDKWHIRKPRNGSALEFSEAGSMWAEGGKTLYVDSSDRKVIDIVESEPGVSFLGEEKVYGMAA